MTTNQFVETPRWGNVYITEEFKDSVSAAIAGFTEPTGRADVKGKIIESKVDENGHGWSKFKWCIIQSKEE